jgi:hypothetical protein
MMFNSRNLGALIVDQEPHVNEWEEPQFGIRNMGIEEKYLSSACSTGFTIAVASLSLCTARCRHRRCSVISRPGQRWRRQRGGSGDPGCGCAAALVGVAGDHCRQAWLSLSTARCRHRRCSVISRFWQRWERLRGGLVGAELDRRHRGIAALHGTGPRIIPVKTQCVSSRASAEFELRCRDPGSRRRLREPESSLRFRRKPRWPRVFGGLESLLITRAEPVPGGP